MFQNYPNPFNAETTIEYWLYQPGNVKIDIFNLPGQKSNTLIDEQQHIGDYDIAWNSRDYWDRDLSSRMYIYKLETNGFSEMKKKLLVK